MSDDLFELEDLKNMADPDVEIHALRRERSQLKAELRRMQAEYGNLKGYFNDLNEALQEVGGILRPLRLQYKPGTTAKSKTPVTAVLHWTDWHYGACQDPDEIESVNSFSPEILEAYIMNLCDDFMRWVELHRNSYRIDELVILDTGDNISGDIHDELRITNAFPSPVQAFKCGMLKGQAIAALAPYFKKVRIEFIVEDNHGRLTKKPQAKQAGLNNHNYTVGHVGRLSLRDHKNVEFNIYEMYTKSVTVAGRQYLLTHGHGVSGWAGFPYYGIDRKVSKEALVRLHEPDANKFHRVVMGHWHAPLKHPHYWIGSSASGTDAFDHKQGRRSTPMQCAWVVHPKHREFDTIDFDLHAD